jgi:hypothetical protein
MPLVTRSLKDTGTWVLIEPNVTFPWAYYEDPRAKIVFGPTFQTGFSFVSSRPRVVLVGESEQGDYGLPAAIAGLSHAQRVISIGWKPPTGEFDKHAATVSALEAACWVPTSIRVFGIYVVISFEHEIGFLRCVPVLSKSG